MEGTFRVIRLVASSAESWEDAARLAVAEAAKTISQLRHARVTEMDAVVGEGEVTRYRLELELAFQLDRARPTQVAGQPTTVTVRRYLIEANETLAGDRVPALVSKRMAAGPAEFHVLVPATRSRETRRLTAVAGDPLSGYAVVDVVGLEEARARDRADARARLVSFTDKLDALGASYTSEVGSPDPYHAVARVMERASFDEIIISTLPTSLSRWLRIDLPSRLQRSYALPVITVTVER